MTSSFVNIDNFFYQVKGNGGTELDGTVTRVVGMQELEIELSEEVVKGYGDGIVQELAKSVGEVEVTSSFHALSIEQRADLYNLKVNDGLYFSGGNNGIKYVAILMQRVDATGGTETIGMFKGIFSHGNIEGATTEDEIEFSSQELSGQFVSIDVPDVGQAAFVSGYDLPGVKTNFYKVYELTFGVPHVDAPVIP